MMCKEMKDVGGREKRRKKEVEKRLEKNDFKTPLDPNQSKGSTLGDHHDRSCGGKRISCGRVGRRDGCFCGYDEAACTRSFRDKRHREEKVP
jgi:hypothetical protein